jgi:O-antigen ligase
VFWAALGTLAAALILGALWLVQNPSTRRGALPARLAEMTNLYSPSMRHRVGLLAVTGRMIADRPFVGSGPGLYGAAFSRTQARLAQTESGVGFWIFGDLLAGHVVEQAHSDPLQWWAEYGLLPLIGLLLMLGRALAGSAAILRERQSRPQPGQVWLAGMWAALATLSLNMWVSFPLHTPTRALTFWALLGLVAGASIHDGA